jgi:hypothetical protein
MLPDFTNLDPTAIAQFWIYVIGSFFVGGGIGFSLCRGLKKIAYKNFKSEKIRFTDEKAKLLAIAEEYEKLKKNLEGNDDYWLYERSKKLSPNSGG